MSANTNPTQAQAMPSERRIIVDGPVANGFFIRDSEMNIWDGESWRGFGTPLYFETFAEAFTQLLNATAKAE